MTAVGVLEELADHADEDALDDGVGDHQRGVGGSPGEGDHQPEHQPDQAGADPGRTGERVRHQHPGRRGGGTGDAEQRDGLDDDVVDGHRLHGGGRDREGLCRRILLPIGAGRGVPGGPFALGRLTEPGQYRVGRLHFQASLRVDAHTACPARVSGLDGPVEITRRPDGRRVAPAEPAATPIATCGVLVPGAGVEPARLAAAAFKAAVSAFPPPGRADITGATIRSGACHRSGFLPAWRHPAIGSALWSRS